MPSDEDWDFSRVPDIEIVPCLLWEFLRESAHACKLANDWITDYRRRMENRSRKTDDPDPGLLWHRTTEIELSINYPCLVERFSLDLPFVWMKEGQADVSWQRLSSAKRRLEAACSQVNRAVFIGNGSHALSLQRFMELTDQDVDVELLARLSRTERDELITHALRPARAPLGSLSKPKSKHQDRNKEAVCVVVDWGLYDDNAVRAAFHELAEEIIKSRPKGIAPMVLKASGRQRNKGDSEWRGKLNDLGRTRLFCAYNGAEHLKRANRKAYDWVAENLADKGSRAVTKAMSDAKTRFVNAFHQALPFEQGKPVCIAGVGKHRRISS